MRNHTPEDCSNCNHHCDIYLTAREMGIEEELRPLKVHYGKRASICRQHDDASHVVVLKEGYAKMYIRGLQGKNIILNILIPSNYIGLLSVFGSMSFPYHVDALTPCITCQIETHTIRQLYYQNHSFLLKLNQEFAASVGAIMNKLVSLNQKQIRGKVAESILYLSRLHDSPSFDLVVTRRELGEMSGITEENTVRILSEFKNDNILLINGKSITILDAVVLQKICNIG